MKTILTYTAHFAPFQRSLEIFQQKIQGDFSPEVKFVEGYEDIASLDELIGRFQGRPIFIDFWFSTCGPCREEFAYAEALYEFLKSRQIQLIYVSIDEENMDKNWKNSIKYFDLKGWQVRTSKALYEDLSKKYGIHSFPTYMLVDALGRIVLPNAKRPSEKEALYRQISEALENR